MGQVDFLHCQESDEMEATFESRNISDGCEALHLTTGLSIIERKKERKKERARDK